MIILEYTGGTHADAPYQRVAKIICSHTNADRLKQAFKVKELFVLEKVSGLLIEHCDDSTLFRVQLMLGKAAVGVADAIV